jgi:plastocyanin
MLRRMNFGSLVSLSSLALTLGLSACGGSDASPADGSPDGSGSAGPATEMVTCTAAVTKEIKTLVPSAFVPASLTVTAGTVVRFIMDPDHNATSTTAGLFTIGYGETACVKFNKAGSYQLGCQRHGFTGTVVVQ